MNQKNIVVKLIPMKNSDNKRMMKKELNPLQRLTILEETQLNTISEFTHHKVFDEDDNSYNVLLHICINGKFSRLPLSINIGELLIMAHQKNEIELRYTFVLNEEKDQEKRTDVNQIPVINANPEEVHLLGENAAISANIMPN